MDIKAAVALRYPDTAMEPTTPTARELGAPLVPTTAGIPQQLIAQFRTYYPTGSLTAELLVANPEHYVVRAMVFVGGVVVGSGMAAAASLEEAEDRARLRALELLGLNASPQAHLPNPPHAPTLTPQATYVQFHVQSQDHHPSPLLEQAHPPEITAPPLAPSVEVSTAEIPLVEIPPVEIPSPEVPPIDVTPAVTPPTSQPKPKSPHSPLPTPHSPFVPDWSDELTQIEVELKRLGWSKQQEIDYLQRSYGKSSRDAITDHNELVDFLGNLRALPSHFAPDFFDTEEITQDTTQDTTTQSTTRAIPAPDPLDDSFVTFDEDMSEVIPREQMMDLILAECQRLNWSKRQGSDYLKAAYGKPTRNDLTNDELSDFLQYLQSLSSAGEQLPF